MVNKPSNMREDLPVSKGHPPPPTKSTRTQRLRQFFDDEIQVPGTLLEAELILSAFACGMIDATTYTDYHMFASNQTGNTVFLGIRALGLVEDTIDIRNVAVSISVFLIGGFIIGQMGRYYGVTRRGWLIVTNTLQVILIYIAAALRHWYALGATFSARRNPKRFSVSALLAFASGGQVAMARSTVPEITTAIVTSAYIDFLSDPNLFKRKNRSRNRLFVFIVALMSGSFVGAALYRFVAPAFAIFVAGLIKTSVIPMLCFNPVKKKETV